MNKEILTFGDIESETCKFQFFKYRIEINIIDVDKTLTFNEVSFGKKGFKFFIVNKDDKKVKPYV